VRDVQDETFDRARGLRSLPARLGAARALGLTRAFHLTALVGFAAFAMIAGGGWLRIAAVAAAAALILWQHRLVRPNDLSAVDAAFFTANGTLSVIMLALFALAKLAG
jgi:4-hydroxybenzoate polyprenyltransferase